MENNQKIVDLLFNQIKSNVEKMNYLKKPILTTELEPYNGGKALGVYLVSNKKIGVFIELRLVNMD